MIFLKKGKGEIKELKIYKKIFKIAILRLYQGKMKEKQKIAFSLKIKKKLNKLLISLRINNQIIKKKLSLSH